MRWLSLVCSFALVLFHAEMGWAQVPASPAPQSESSTLRNLAARLAKAKPAAKTADSATRFTPSGKRITLDSFVANMVTEEEDRKNLATLMTAAFKAYEETAEKAGVENDVAGALGFYLAAHYNAYKGVAISDRGTEILIRQLQTALDTEQMRAAKDGDKQHLYEYFVMMGTLTAISYEMAVEQKDAQLKKNLQETGGAGLRGILKIAPDRVALDDTGIHIAAEGKPVSPTATAKATNTTGPLPGLEALSYSVPAGWAEKKAALVITLSISSDDLYSPFSCTVILGAPRDRPAKLTDAFAPAWTDLITPNFTGKEPEFSYICRLESGLNCTFAGAEMKANQNGAVMEVTLYLVDTGNQVFPVLILGAGYSPKYLPVVEKFVNTLTIRGARPSKALLQPAELAGTWTTSDRLYATYVTARGDYAGDASIATSETTVFQADGTYSSNFMGISSGKVVKEKGKGTFRIDGDLLIMTTAAGKTTKKRIIRNGLAPDGKGRMLLMLNPVYPLRPGNIGLYGEKFFLLPPK